MWKRTILRDNYYFKSSRYLPSLHFGHSISLARFLWNNTQPFTHVWIFLYPKPRLVICALHALSFVGNVESNGINQHNNANNSSKFYFFQQCTTYKLRIRRIVVKCLNLQVAYTGFEASSIKFFQSSLRPSFNIPSTLLPSYDIPSVNVLNLHRIDLAKQ